MIAQLDLWGGEERIPEPRAIPTLVPFLPPVIKWAGGKRRLLGEILPRLPAKIDRYYEPCVGAGAVFLALAHERRFVSARISDLNPDLIDWWRAVSERGADLADDVEALLSSGESFEAIRDSFLPALLQRRAARFYVVQRGGFNGLWRVNRTGKNNVPRGTNWPPKPPDRALLARHQAALAGVEIERRRCVAAFDDAGPGDAVYIDPPYDGSFTAYTAAGFSWDDQVELAHAANCAAERGAFVMLSNAATERVVELYQGLGFHVETVGVRWIAGCTSESKQKVAKEVIATKGGEQ